MAIEKSIPATELVELLKTLPPGTLVSAQTRAQTGDLRLFSAEKPYLGYVDVRERKVVWDANEASG